MLEGEPKTIWANETFPKVNPLEHWLQKMLHTRVFCGQMKLANIPYHGIILKSPNGQSNDKGTENPTLEKP